MKMPKSSSEGDTEEFSASNTIPEASQSTDMTEQRPAQSEGPINDVGAEEGPEAVEVPAGAPGIVPEDEDYEPTSAADLRRRPAF